MKEKAAGSVSMKVLVGRDELEAALSSVCVLESGESEGALYARLKVEKGEPAARLTVRGTSSAGFIERMVECVAEVEFDVLVNVTAVRRFVAEVRPGVISLKLDKGDHSLAVSSEDGDIIRVPAQGLDDVPAALDGEVRVTHVVLGKASAFRRSVERMMQVAVTRRGDVVSGYLLHGALLDMKARPPRLVGTDGSRLCVIDVPGNTEGEPIDWPVISWDALRMLATLLPAEGYVGPEPEVKMEVLVGGMRDGVRFSWGEVRMETWHVEGLFHDYKKLMREKDSMQCLVGVPADDLRTALRKACSIGSEGKKHAVLSFSDAPWPSLVVKMRTQDGTVMSMVSGVSLGKRAVLNVDPNDLNEALGSIEDERVHLGWDSEAGPIYIFADGVQNMIILPSAR